MKRSFLSILFILISFNMYAKDCSNLEPAGFPANVGNSSSKYDANACIQQWVDSHPDRVRVHNNLMMIDRGDGDYFFIKFEKSLGNLQNWGNENVYIENTPGRTDTSRINSGNNSIREKFKEEHMDWIVSRGIDPDNIHKAKDRLNMRIGCNEEQVQNSCTDGQRYNPVKCRCEAITEDNACSARKKQRELDKCADKNSRGNVLPEITDSGEIITSQDTYKVQKVWIYDPIDCKCREHENPQYIPPGAQRCVEHTSEFQRKQTKCENRDKRSSDNKYFEFDADTCSCNPTRLFCKGKYTKEQYDAEKASCNSKPKSLWAFCKCITPNNDRSQCTGPRFEERERKCLAKNSEEKHIERGNTFYWEDCDCKKLKDPPEPAEEDKTCMDKVSPKKIERCIARDGIFDEETCKCDAPCYDITSDTETLQDGLAKCVYNGTEITYNDPKVLSDNVGPVLQEQCTSVVSEINMQDLKKGCRDQLGMDLDHSEGAQSKSYKIKLQLPGGTSKCEFNMEDSGDGFADKIPGLVGGLDLEKDFSVNGNKGVDPSQINCASDRVVYSPASNSTGRDFKTSPLSEEQCNNVKEMYSNVSEKAKALVDSIKNNPNLDNEKMKELIKQNFQSAVFATANRVPHGNGKVDHTELSNKRAESMNQFYKEQVLKYAEGLGLSESDLQDTSSGTVPYFGPIALRGENFNLSQLANESDPGYQNCSTHLSGISRSTSVNTMRSSHNSKLKAYYECVNEFHVNNELDQLASFAGTNGTNTIQNFNAAIKNNPQFASFLTQVDGELDIFGKDKGLYKDFLDSMYDKPNEMQTVLDSMKIFDINVATGGKLNYDVDIQRDVELECNINFEDLYKDEPIFKDVEVFYGKRPGFIERFSKKCREDFNQMIDGIQAKFAAENQDLKAELIANHGPEKGLKKFNRKMRRKARRLWRKAKYNTRSAAKGGLADQIGDGLRRRWNQLSGAHEEDDAEVNYTQIYNEIKESIENEDWTPSNYKFKVEE